jgi:ribonuclease D
MDHFDFVDPGEHLPDDLAAEELIGVDTEFMREKTFFAQLCLVQLSTSETIYFADPLNGSNWQSFWDRTLDKTWVLHSARQDLEVVSQSAGRMPAKIFDTQVAAGLLGLAPQLGYANLCKELFDVDMAKSHTRADWTRRPLPDAWLHYAAEDVEYLLPACDVLSESLDRKGRLEWAEQDSAALLDPALYTMDAAQAIARLKGARNLRGAARAVAERLAAWREKQAIRSDKPRQWIARDTLLMELANKQPSSIDELGQIEGMPPKLKQRAGAELLELIATADDDNDYSPPAVPDEEQKALLKQMQALVAKAAKELELSPETIASRKDLLGVIDSGTEGSKIFSGWRNDVIGDDLARLL